MNDIGYEKLLGIIKKVNSKKQNIYIGTMQSGDTCKINSLLLEREDLYISEHLVTGYVIEKNDEYQQVGELKKGDIVLVIRISDDKFCVLERIV